MSMARNEEQPLSPELQRELYEARNYHIGLHVEYTQLKNTYEKTVKLSEKEWATVEEHGLGETFNKLISTFWENIEFITTAFFDILEILGGKESMDRTLHMIWKDQLLLAKNEVSSQSQDNIALPTLDQATVAAPSYSEYLNSQLTELRGRIKWVEFNMMKYKFAAAHGPALRAAIADTLKHPKRMSKWQMFPLCFNQMQKLEDEVHWYKKRLKFFKGEMQRMEGEHHTILERFLSPEDRKKFPSIASSLEFALLGSPSNYRTSWFEKNRCFNLVDPNERSPSSSTSSAEIHCVQTNSTEINSASVSEQHKSVNSLVTQYPQPSEGSNQTVISIPVPHEKCTSPNKGKCYHQCPGECHNLNRECSTSSRSQSVAETKISRTASGTCASISVVGPPRYERKIGDGSVNKAEYQVRVSSQSGNRAFSTLSAEYNPFHESETVASSMYPETSTNPFDDDDDYAIEGVHKAEKPLVVYERTKQRQCSDPPGNSNQKNSVDDSSYHSAEEVSIPNGNRHESDKSADGCQTLPGNCFRKTDDSSAPGGIQTLPVFPFTYPTDSEFSMMSRSADKQSSNVIRRFSSFMQTKKK